MSIIIHQVNNRTNSPFGPRVTPNLLQRCEINPVEVVANHDINGFHPQLDRPVDGVTDI